MKRDKSKLRHDLLKKMIKWVEKNHNVHVVIFEDDPGTWCTEDILVNGQVTLAKNKSYIVLYTASEEKYAEELLICLLHELGHHFHFEECDRDHDKFYDEFSPLQREFNAWDYALQAFELGMIPKKYIPNLVKFKFMMDVCLDDYYSELK
jgi:hypothetical protein